MKDIMRYIEAIAIILAAIIGGLFVWYIDHVDNKSPLEIASISANGSSIDILVRNSGQSDAIIHNILITVLGDYDLHGPITMDYLNSSREYNMPIGDLTVGKSWGMHIFQLIAARKVDRFVINLDTNRHLLLNVELKYNKYQIVSGDVILNANVIRPEMPRTKQVKREDLPNNKSQKIYSKTKYIIREVPMK